MTITTIILESDDPSPVLVVGLIVRIFDTSGVFVTSGVSDSSGEVIVDIPDADYDLYFFKAGVSVTNGMPQRITVDVADMDTPPNTFKIIVNVATLPQAVDPLLCRISGSIIGADGAPTRAGRFITEPCKETGVLGTNVLAPQHSVSIEPDENGLYAFNLLRNAKYRTIFYMLETLLGKDPPELDTRVPDLPALALTDFLFPVPVNADFDLVVLALTAGDPFDESIVLTVSYSDGSDRATAPRFAVVASVSDDEAVATVELQGKKVIVTPLTVGTANITITRTISDTIYYDPVPAFVTETLVVTVS